MENYLVSVIAIAISIIAIAISIKTLTKINDYLFEKRKELELNKIRTETFTINENQEKILYWISDGIHNIGNDFYKNNIKFKINDKEFMENLGYFFACTRRLCSNIKNGSYSNEEYENILHFIENDFHDFCHYKNQNLDLERYKELIH